MSISNSRQAYLDCYELYDRALEDPLGARLKVKSYDAALYLRMRLHQARKIHRRDNADIYDYGHPMHGASTYDALTVRIKRHGDAFWVYAERSPDISGDIEQLSQVAEGSVDEPAYDPPPPEPEPEPQAWAGRRI